MKRLSPISSKIPIRNADVEKTNRAFVKDSTNLTFNLPPLVSLTPSWANISGDRREGTQEKVPVGSDAFPRICPKALHAHCHTNNIDKTV